MAKRKLILYLFLLGLIVVMLLPGFSRLQELKEDNKVMAEKIEALNQEVASLEEEKRRLREDSFYLEKKVREKLGLVKKGEIVYKIVEEK